MFLVTGTRKRRATRPSRVFDGEVANGRNYILVDDFVGQGGTLANLRGYALSEGAVVIGAAALTGKGYYAELAMSSLTLHSIRGRYGKELESWWRQIFGYGFDKLTESEARYLLRAENAHTIRDRVAQARSEAKP
jgi:hypoxanthine-guanine phosphoribosyltransferase